MQTRRSLREMLKRKAGDQAAQAAKQSKPPEVEAAKLDQKNSKRKALHDIQRGKTECKEDKNAKLFKQSIVPDEFIATYEHDPKLPGINGQTEAIYGRLRARADQEQKATYDHDPQLPGIKGQTELLKLRINKRLRDESGSCDAEARRPVKKQKATEPKIKQPCPRTDKKHELNAILRIARAKTD